VSLIAGLSPVILEKSGQGLAIGMPGFLLIVSKPMNVKIPLISSNSRPI
jgi:hypothetical protein